MSRDVLAAYLNASAQPPPLLNRMTTTAAGKLYLGGPRLPLCPPRLQPQPGAGCTRQDLSDLLFYSFGVSRLHLSTPNATRTTLELRRPVGSGGALYPTQLYVSHQGVPGVPDGLSHFDPLHHQLAVLLYGDPLTGPDRPAHHSGHPPRITVLLTSASWNTMPKYQHFGYRLITLEFGMVAEQLGIVGHALGARCSLTRAWPDAFSRWIQPTGDERPGPVVTLEWPDTERPKVTHNAPVRTGAVSRSPAAPGLTTCPLAWQVEIAAANLPAAPHSSSSPETLTPCPGGASSVFRRLRARRSSGEGFRNVPISGTALRNAISEVSEWIDGHDTTLLMVARAITGIRPGIYRFDRLNPAPVPASCPDPAVLLLGGTPRATAQSNQPAAWLYLTAKLDLHSDESAARYRDTQIRIGRLLQRLHLACTAQGIDGHVSLAYDVHLTQHLFSLNGEWYPAAQLVLGTARPDTEHFSVDFRATAPAWPTAPGR